VKTAINFLAALIKAVPYRIHTVLTDNGVQFGETAFSTAQARPPATGCTCSIVSAASTRSSIARAIRFFEQAQFERLLGVISLHQRIRSRGVSPAKMEIRASWA
jgi:hypothetical protein